jgi:hypothetical protein
MMSMIDSKPKIELHNSKYELSLEHVKSLSSLKLPFRGRKEINALTVPENPRCQAALITGVDSIIPFRVLRARISWRLRMLAERIDGKMSLALSGHVMTGVRDSDITTGLKFGLGETCRYLEDCGREYARLGGRREIDKLSPQGTQAADAAEHWSKIAADAQDEKGVKFSLAVTYLALCNMMIIDLLKGALHRGWGGFFLAVCAPAQVVVSIVLICVMSDQFTSFKNFETSMRQFKISFATLCICSYSVWQAFSGVNYFGAF